MSLRFRINLIITVLIVLFSLVTAKIVVDDARRSIREEMEAGTKVTLQLLTTVLYSSQFVRSDGGSELACCARSCTASAACAPTRSACTRTTVRSLYTSPPPVYKAGRAAPHWFSALVTPELPEVELRVRSGRIVVTPDASRSILDAWDDMKNLIWLALGFLVLVNVVVFWLLGRALRPVKPILRGLSEMERGRLDTRLPGFSLPEFDSISHTFNRMAGRAGGESRREHAPGAGGQAVVRCHHDSRPDRQHLVLEPGGRTTVRLQAGSRSWASRPRC